MTLLLLFFGGVLLLIGFIALVLVKCNEAQQIIVLKGVGIFILLAFMMQSESARIRHSEQIEELQEQVKITVKQLEIIPEHKKWKIIKP